MILYLNKNLNENSKNPFKSRFNNYSSLDVNNNQINNGSFGLGNNNLNLNLNPNMKNIETNSNLNTNLNINNELDQNFGIHSQTSNNKINNNYLQNSLSSNASGMIMPETNFTGYNKFNDKTGTNLAHKYGGSVSNSMSINNNENNLNDNFGISAKNADFNNNLEEEYPRTLAQPQSQIIRK